jgi:phosphoribosylglycinamide formyltransferase-1
MSARRRTAILISGRGSNMTALIDAARDPGYPAEIGLVVSNRAAAGGLERARAAGIATATVSYKAAGPAAAEAGITATLEAHGIDLVCLAGYMRLLSAGFVAHWHDRMINIHPSLLPLFPGLDTHERALAAGVRLHGCTVHFVRHEMDSGPIIGQAAVPVLDTDTPETLADRVLGAEHALYPKALALVAAGRVRVENERCVFTGPPADRDGMLVSI